MPIYTNNTTVTVPDDLVATDVTGGDGANTYTTGLTFPFKAELKSFSGNRRLIVATPSANTLTAIDTDPVTIKFLNLFHDPVTISISSVDHNVYLSKNDFPYPQGLAKDIEIDLQTTGTGNATNASALALDDGSGTSNFFGRPFEDIGPCKLVINDIDFGATESTTLRYADTIVETTNSLNGTAPSGGIVTGQDVTVEIGLKRATIERLEEAWHGLNTTSESDGDIDGFFLSSTIGLDIRNGAVEMELTRIVNGAPSLNPLDTVIFPAVAPMSTSEIVFDAESQKVITVNFRCYATTTNVDNLGRPIYAYASGTDLNTPT